MIWPAPCLAFLATRAATEIHRLVWVTAADRITGDPVSVGLWTGAETRNFTIGGETRTYIGAQGALTVPPVSYVAGTEIATLNVSLSVSPEADALVRGYETQFRPAEIHYALFDPSDDTLVGVTRAFFGTIDGAPSHTPVKNGVGTIELVLVSSARAGTITGNAKKSDASQRLRSATDTMRLYGDLGTVSSDIWGAGDMQPGGTPPPGGTFGGTGAASGGGGAVTPVSGGRFG